MYILRCVSTLMGFHQTNLQRDNRNDKGNPIYHAHVLVHMEMKI